MTTTGGVAGREIFFWVQEAIARDKPTDNNNIFLDHDITVFYGTSTLSRFATSWIYSHALALTRVTWLPFFIYGQGLT